MPDRPNSSEDQTGPEWRELTLLQR
jgi:hypothetical protein